MYIVHCSIKNDIMYSSYKLISWTVYHYSLYTLKRVKKNYLRPTTSEGRLNSLFFLNIESNITKFGLQLISPTQCAKKNLNTVMGQRIYKRVGEIETFRLTSQTNIFYNMHTWSIIIA